MMKLKRYLKPYIGFALAAIVLMFCQAAVDLNLPNLMSDIVNVGIQQGGITEAAPKAVSAEGLQPVFLCSPERVHFYTCLGFEKLGEYARYEQTEN